MLKTGVSLSLLLPVGHMMVNADRNILLDSNKRAEDVIPAQIVRLPTFLCHVDCHFICSLQKVAQLWSLHQLQLATVMWS